jgi:hypothetical protein
MAVLIHPIPHEAIHQEMNGMLPSTVALDAFAEPWKATLFGEYFLDYFYSTSIFLGTMMMKKQFTFHGSRKKLS